MANIIDILLVEDNPADIDLIQESLRESKVLCKVNAVRDGEEAMDYLHQRNGYEDTVRPDIVLLDLNMPRKDGREVLSEIKQHPELKILPIIVMTSSSAEEDILRSYQLHANAYVTKPVDLESFDKIVHAIEDFWFAAVRYPNEVR